MWADKGNVFVFISDRIYVASTAHYRELDGLGVDEPRAADVEEGRLTVFGKDGWRHILPPERKPGRPSGLATGPSHGPSGVSGKLSAILRGLDNNVYLFGDQQCYDLSLERQYPTGASWGHVQNRIAEDELVDCALMGRDGKLTCSGATSSSATHPRGHAYADPRSGRREPIARGRPLGRPEERSNPSCRRA